MFKYIAALTALWLLSTCPHASAQNLLNGPETVVFDSVAKRYFVSNFYSGDIIEIDSNGSYTVFVDELSSTMGLHIVGNTLYVASRTGSIVGIVGYDMTTRARIAHVEPNFLGFINGLASDTSGYLYATDTQYNRIYKIRLSDLQTSVFVSSGITLPNGVFFDRRHNRLLVASNVTGSPVYAVSLADSSVSAATITTGEFDGFGEDQLHNLYVSWSSAGTIYRFDSTLAQEGEIVSALHNQPEGIEFNQLYSTLCVPNMFGNTISFIPFDVDVWATCDVQGGWAPMDVQFNGFSQFQISNWLWDFGDGTGSTEQNPLHTFEAGGHFDVKLQAVTDQGDTLVRVYPRWVASLADTLWLEMGEPAAGSPMTVEAVVYARSSLALDRIRIPVEYDGTLDLRYASYSTDGCLTSGFEVQDIVAQDSVAKTMTFNFRPRASGSPLYVGSGEGPVLKVTFQIPEGLQPGKVAEVRLDGYVAGQTPLFSRGNYQYTPSVRSATIGIPGCCLPPTTGDIDQSGVVDITDVQILIDNQFLSLAPLTCDAEGDLDFSGVVDVSDISILIDNQFISLAPLPPCP